MNLDEVFRSFVGAFLGARFALDRQKAQSVEIVRGDVLNVAHIDGANTPVGDDLATAFAGEPITPRNFARGPSANKVKDREPPLYVPSRLLAKDGSL